MASHDFHGEGGYSSFTASTIKRSTTDGSDDNSDSEPMCFLSRIYSRCMPILHPVGPFRCVWDMIVMIVLIYTSVEIPYTLAFGHNIVISWISLFVDLTLLCDIFLNFHTAYFDKYDNLRLVTNKKFICKKYFKTWFFIDILTSIPYELFIARYANTGNDGNSSSADNNSHGDKYSELQYIKILRIFRLVRIIKILRFLKMLRIFDSFMKQFVMREVIILLKLLKIVAGMLLFAHFASCLWWFVGINGMRTENHSWISKIDIAQSLDTTSDFAKYSYAWYWAVVTLFTTGYGDIVATNTTEQWVCTICILIGTCFFAYFVGTLTILITEGDKIKAYELEKLEEAQSFCEKKKLPKELTRAVLTHIRYHCRYNYVFDEHELLDLLPPYLKHDVNTSIARHFLSSLEILNNDVIQLEQFIIGQIATKIKSISCNQGYKLFKMGDIANEFYIQRTGLSSLHSKVNGHSGNQHELYRGSVCGEFGAILHEKRRNEVVCETWSEFYVISVFDIKETLQTYYPDSWDRKFRKIQKYARKARKERKIHSCNFGIHNKANTLSGLQKAVNTNNIHIHIHQPNLSKENSVHIMSINNSTNSKKYKQTKFHANTENTNNNNNGASSPIPPNNDDEMMDDFEIKYRDSTHSKTHKTAAETIELQKTDFNARNDDTNANGNNKKKVKIKVKKTTEKRRMSNNNKKNDIRFTYHNTNTNSPSIQALAINSKSATITTKYCNNNINNNNHKKNNKSPRFSSNANSNSTAISSAVVPTQTPKFKSKFSKLHFRSNSELRNAMVLAHTVKHIDDNHRIDDTPRMAQLQRGMTLFNLENKTPKTPKTPKSAAKSASNLLSRTQSYRERKKTPEMSPQLSRFNSLHSHRSKSASPPSTQLKSYPSAPTPHFFNKNDNNLSNIKVKQSKHNKNTNVDITKSHSLTKSKSSKMTSQVSGRSLVPSDNDFMDDDSQFESSEFSVTDGVGGGVSDESFERAVSDRTDSGHRMQSIQRRKVKKGNVSGKKKAGKGGKMGGSRRHKSSHKRKRVSGRTSMRGGQNTKRMKDKQKLYLDEHSNSNYEMQRNDKRVTFDENMLLSALDVKDDKKNEEITVEKYRKSVGDDRIEMDMKTDDGWVVNGDDDDDALSIIDDVNDIIDAYPDLYRAMSTD